MVSSTARKYARALADVARESNATERVEQDLRAFAEAFQKHGELREVLFSPTVPLDAKRKIVEQVAKGMGLIKIVVNFLLVILEHSRLGLLEEFVEAYQDVLDDFAGVVRVEVFSSYPLRSGVQGRLEKVMTELTGKVVKLSYRVDETLIGGVKLQLGSMVFDGTIRTQLEELRRQLAFTSV
jgi:F-type H+-transporting ATPase subunit delta